MNNTYETRFLMDGNLMVQVSPDGCHARIAKWVTAKKEYVFLVDFLGETAHTDAERFASDLILKALYA